MPTSIVDLWLAGTLPIHSALYRADGTAITVRFEPSAPGGLSLLEPYPFEDLIQAEPDYVSKIDITVQQKLPDGTGYLVCGEGSYGSDGFFGRLDAAERLIWVLFLENCNPFVNVTVVSSFAIFASSSGVVVTVDLEAPGFGVVA